MHRMQSPYGRRLVNFHREHGISPRNTANSPFLAPRLAVVPRTPASKPGRVHPLMLVFAVMTVLGLALVAVEYGRAIAREGQVEADATQVAR